jgi:hypothetical protein
MLGALESILFGVLDIPFLVIGLLVESLNGWIEAMGLLIGGLVALLPSFPDVPTIPADAAAAAAWLLPVAGVLGVFVVMLGLWLTFMGLKIALNWGKVKM